MKAHVLAAGAVLAMGLGIGTDANAQRSSPLRPLYRTHHSEYTDYFYTRKPEQRDEAVGFYGYAYEGIAAYVEQTTVRGGAAKEFSRFFIGFPQLEHFYTISPYERSIVQSYYGYVYEGEEGYIYETQIAGTVPFYRLSHYNGANGALQHYYTTSTWEKSYFASQGWNDEGPAGYVWPVPVPATTASVSFAPNPNFCGLYSCYTATNSAYIYIPGVRRDNLSSYFGTCDGTVRAYRDGVLLRELGTLDWTWGVLPGSFWTYGCYSSVPIWQFGGTPGPHEIRLEFSGYSAERSDGSWITHPPSTLLNTYYFYSW